MDGDSRFTTEQIPKHSSKWPCKICPTTASTRRGYSRSKSAVTRALQSVLYSLFTTISCHALQHSASTGPSVLAIYSAYSRLRTGSAQKRLSRGP